MATEIQVKTDDAPKAVSRVKQHDRFPWQRLALSVFGILIVVLKWRWAVFHLYALPKDSYAAFSSLNTNSDYVIGAIVIFMISGKLVYDWKNQTASTVIEQAEQIFEHRESKEEKVITIRTEGGAKAFADDL